MAILNGIIKKMTGSVGQLTFKTVNGQTVVSEKVTNVRNSRSQRQQRQRMKWVNIIHMYSGISPLLKNAFEKKSSTQSDYNMFVKVNNSSAPVYLTKTEADGGGCIAAPYQITQGSLPSIVTAGEGSDSVTDIVLGGLVITADTTVAQFSQAVVDNNADYDYGDQISFYDIMQRINSETHIPYCQFGASYVILDKESGVKLWDLANKVGFASVDGVLGHGDDEGDGVFAWVHSRNVNGKTKVSTQILIDNNSIAPDYMGEVAYRKACNSYGGSNSAFLQPENDMLGAPAGDTDNGEETTVKRMLTLKASPEEGGMVTGAGEYDDGTTASIEAVANGGYTFQKWSDNDTNAKRTVVMNSDIELTALFQADAGEMPDTE